MGDPIVIRATNSNSSGDLITEIDLAAYSEGLLSSDRARIVEQFLNQHDELREYLGITIPSSAESPPCDIASASGTDEDQTVAPPLPRSRMAQPGTPARAKNGTRSRISVALKYLAAAIVCTTGLWCLQQTYAIEAAIGDSADQIGSLPPAERDSTIRFLEQIHGSMFLTQRDDLRRRKILAAVYVDEARSHHTRLNSAESKTIPSQNPGIEYCDRAIRLLEGVSGSGQTPEVRHLLADAWLLKGQIQYQYGTYDAQAFGKRLPRFFAAAQSFLTGLEQLDQQDQSLPGKLRRCQLGGLLAKSIYKGVNPDTAELDQITPRIRVQFSSIGEDTLARRELLIGICEELIADSNHVASSDQDNVAAEFEVAVLKVYNTLQFATRPDRQLQKQVLLDGIERANQYSGPVTKEFALVHGRLLGNMADLHRKHSMSLDDEIAYRKQAIDIFQSARLIHRDNELNLELGWVIGRQLLTEYRKSARMTSGLTTSVYSLHGAFKLMTDNFHSMRGMQLASDEPFVRAIHAEISGDESDIDSIAAEILAHSNWAQTIKSQYLLETIVDFQNNPVLKNRPEFIEALAVAKQAIASSRTE